MSVYALSIVFQCLKYVSCDDFKDSFYDDEGERAYNMGFTPGSVMKYDG